MIKKYVKNLTIVEAVIYTVNVRDWEEISSFTGLKGFDGLTTVSIGDYIIKHSSGKITCCSSDVFKDEYSEVLGETE